MTCYDYIIKRLHGGAHDKCSADPDRGTQLQRVDLLARPLHYDHLQSTVAKFYSRHSKWLKFWRMGDAGNEWGSYIKEIEMSGPILFCRKFLGWSIDITSCSYSPTSTTCINACNS